jgi:hypothetical protein
MRWLSGRQTPVTKVAPNEPLPFEEEQMSAINRGEQEASADTWGLSDEKLSSLSATAEPAIATDASAKHARHVDTSAPESIRSSLSDSAATISDLSDKSSKITGFLKDNSYISEETAEKLGDISQGLSEASETITSVTDNAAVKVVTEAYRDSSTIVAARAGEYKDAYRLDDTEASGAAWVDYAMKKTGDLTQGFADDYLKLPKVEKAIEYSTSLAREFGFISKPVADNINSGAGEFLKLPTNVIGKEAPKAFENTVERISRSQRMIEELNELKETIPLRRAYDPISGEWRNFIKKGNVWVRVEE